MVASFLLLTFLILVLALVSFYTLNKTIEIARIHSNINQLEIFTLNLIKSDNDFFSIETINESYFATHQSKFLKARDSLNHEIDQKIEEVRTRSKNKSYNINEELNTIDSALKIYNSKFIFLEKEIYRKGFKDFGYEGAMRFHAHALEENSKQADVAKILYLRRNEKDFLLRNDTVYLQAFRSRAIELLAEMKKEPLRNQENIHHAQEYLRLFLELAKIQKRIDQGSTDGLRNQLSVLSSFISQKYFHLSEYSYQQSSQAQENAKILYIFILCGAVTFSILSGYWISKRLSEPITRLSRLVNKSIKSQSSDRVDFSLRNAANEIVVLTNSFVALMDQTRSQMNEIEEKSKLLKKRNQQLKRVNRELDHFLYSSAHDMRSPLSSLLGLINIARIENNQIELDTYLHMMEKSVLRQEMFIEQIVSFSKNKITDIQIEPLDLTKMVLDIIEHHNFAEGSQRIIKQVQINQRTAFYSDGNRLIIILSNLISNSIRYADFQKPEQVVRIEIEVDNKEATITFSDNGIGIHEIHLPKIFEMFYRAHASSKGTGLGLFILSKTVKRMNGQIDVKSQEMEGTTFIVKLPNQICHLKTDKVHLNSIGENREK